MHSDSPVQVEKQDLLERYNFAKDIVRSILKTKENGQEARSLGISGDWGCGKTSLLNFMASEILLNTKEAPYQNVIFEFNPWRITTEEKLLDEFLGDLSMKLIKYQKTYEILRKSLNIFFDGIDQINEVNPDPGSKMIIKSLSKIGKSLNKESSLEQKKLEVDEVLKAKNIRLFIFIDDIDRCTPEQIAHLLQIIRLNANFINTHFFIAYDKSVVQSALETQYQGFGSKYLEKIIQVEYSVPKIQQSVLKDQFIKSLTRLNTKFQLGIDNDNIEFCWNSGINSLLVTLRQLYRLSNAIELRIINLVNDINPIDFIILESIRIFDHQAFEWIFENKNDLVFHKSVPVLAELAQEPEKKSLTEYIMNHKALVNRSNRIRKLIFWLFEGMHTERGSFLQEKEMDYEALLREKRIAADKYFEHYFTLAISKDNFSTQEIRTYVESSYGQQEKLLLQSIHESRLQDLLSDVNNQLLLTDDFLVIQNIKNLLNFCDKQKLEDKETPIFQAMIFGISECFRILVKNKKVESLFELLFQNETISYSRMFFLKRLIERVNNELPRSEIDFIPEADVNERVETIRKKYESLVESFGETVVTDPDLYSLGLLKSFLTEYYKYFEDKYRLGLEKLMQDPHGLIVVFKASLTEARQTGTSEVGFNLSNQHILPALTIEKLELAMGPIPESELNGNDLLYYKLFKKLQSNRFNKDQFYKLNLEPWRP